MNEHPIENLMVTAMSSIQDMVDVNTIIGEPIETQTGITIIPISKVSFGFAAGGSEFRGETLKEYTRKDKDEEIEYKLPFGGGAGAGVSINPVAFLVVQEGNVKLMPVDHESCIDKLLDYIPDLMQRINEMFNKSIKQKEEKTKKIINEMKNRRMTYEEKEVTIIEDMYCPGEKITFNQNMVNTITNKECRKNTCNIREKLNVPELEKGEIIDTEITPVINKENKLSGKIMFEGEMNIKLIFTDDSAVGINSKQITVPFEQTIDNIETNDNCKNNTNVEISSEEILNQSGVISANVDLELETNMYKQAEIPVISDVSAEDEENMEDYSVIIYVVKKGDSLWQIAKNFASTVDDIARVNGIENPDKLMAGEKIYIPKYVLKRAKEPIIIR